MSQMDKKLLFSGRQYLKRIGGQAKGRCMYSCLIPAHGGPR